MPKVIFEIMGDRPQNLECPLTDYDPCQTRDTGSFNKRLLAPETCIGCQTVGKPGYRPLTEIGPNTMIRCATCNKRQ
jgi:hypothetical protein